MKLPNGYGTVYKLPGNRRRPYIVRKAVRYTDEGKPVYETIGYYATKEEGFKALVEFNDNPYDLVRAKMTFSEVYEKWSQITFPKLKESSIRNYETPYKACSELYSMPIGEIRKPHMQKVINECGKGVPSMNRIRILFNQIFEYCIDNELVKKNYAETLTIPDPEDEEERKQKMPFTKKEINTLWEKEPENEYIRVILILIYSGVRISELLDLKKEDTNLEEQYFNVRASKTESGIRTVPIADKVLSFWKAFMNKSKSEYVICTPEGKHMTYDNFKKRYWFPIMKEYDMNHLPHETRHTCISLLTEQNVNSTHIKIIVGHKSIMNVTERVYTHLDNKTLLEDINKI